MKKYVVCRHVVEGKIWYGLSGNTSLPPWVHLEAGTLYLSVSGPSTDYHTAYEGKEGSEIVAIDGKLVADHLRTKPTPPADDNLGELPDCGKGHSWRDPNFTAQAFSLFIP